MDRVLTLVSKEVTIVRAVILCRLKFAETRLVNIFLTPLKICGV